MCGGCEFGFRYKRIYTVIKYIKTGGQLKMTNEELKAKATAVRKGIVTGVHAAKAGHPGGSLSAADIFTFLYFEEM